MKEHTHTRRLKDTTLRSMETVYEFVGVGTFNISYLLTVTQAKADPVLLRKANSN